MNSWVSMGLPGECYLPISVMWKVPEPQDFLTGTLGLFVQNLITPLENCFLALLKNPRWDQTATSSTLCSLDRSRVGKNPAKRPTAGRNEQTKYTNLISVISANSPKRAAPSPAIPKANP